MTGFIAAHTPGPWELSPMDIRSVGPIDVYTRDHRRIACIVATALGAGAEERANARLIAAAPDLLAACKLALGAFERNDAIDWDDLARAIAKAEGR